MGLMVLEKNIFRVFPYISLWKLMTRTVVNLGPRDMVDMIYVGNN